MFPIAAIRRTKKINKKNILIPYQNNLNVMFLLLNSATASFIFSEKRNLAMQEKCPYSEFLWLVFSRIRTEYEVRHFLHM